MSESVRIHMATVRETAEMFGVPTYFVRQKAKQGEIVAVMAGNKTLINVDRFTDYLNTHTITPDENETEKTIDR